VEKELVDSVGQNADFRDSIFEEEVGFWDILWNKKFRKPLALTVTLGVMSQLTGINIFISYSTYIFHDLQFSERQSMYGTLTVGFVNAITVLIGMCFVDRLGRKPLI